MPGKLIYAFRIPYDETEELKSAWADGTPHLLFEPRELLEKLAALIPRSRVCGLAGCPA